MSIPLERAFLYDGIPVDAERQSEPANAREAAEAVLVSRARTGDLDAFEELVRRYRNDVYAMAYHFVREREQAWDISQEVFIKAHRSLGRFRGEASFKTWLLRITVNQCKDHLKKRRLQTVAFDEAIGSEETPSNVLGPRHALEAREIGEAIDKAVAGLSSKHRAAFVLREYEGLSYDEMARVMQCSLGTVMSRLHHARKKLQSSLLRMGVGEMNNE
jgi:RNA polymerase sigma-70 factor (ECF subfamily)